MGPVDEPIVTDISNEGEGAAPPPPAVAGTQPNWAEYMVCPVCGNILSGKKKKLHQVKEGLWVHKSCYALAKADMEKNRQKAREAK